MTKRIPVYMSLESWRVVYKAIVLTAGQCYEYEYEESKQIAEELEQQVGEGVGGNIVIPVNDEACSSGRV